MELWCHLPGPHSQDAAKAKDPPAVWLAPRSAGTPRWAASGPEFGSFSEQQEIRQSCTLAGGLGVTGGLLFKKPRHRDTHHKPKWPRW